VCAGIVDQKINIALRSGFTSRDRAKHTHVEGTMLSGNGDNFLALFFESFANAHDHSLQIKAGLASQGLTNG